jgi:hypothetical protein
MTTLHYRAGNDDARLHAYVHACASCAVVSLRVHAAPASRSIGLGARGRQRDAYIYTLPPRPRVASVSVAFFPSFRAGPRQLCPSRPVRRSISGGLSASSASIPGMGFWTRNKRKDKWKLRTSRPRADSRGVSKGESKDTLVLNYVASEIGDRATADCTLLFPYAVEFSANNATLVLQ